MTTLVFYEGVLRSHKGQPIIDGFRLVQTLALPTRVVLVTSDTKEAVAHQLRTERLLDLVADIIDSSAGLDPIPLWQRQIEYARSKWSVDMLVTSDPAVAEYAVEHGMVALFFAHPGFSIPAQRPEQGSRTWDQLTDELDRRWS